jgi:hypothetical protein
VYGSKRLVGLGSAKTTCCPSGDQLGPVSKVSSLVARCLASPPVEGGVRASLVRSRVVPGAAEADERQASDQSSKTCQQMALRRVDRREEFTDSGREVHPLPTPVPWPEIVQRRRLGRMRRPPGWRTPQRLGHGRRREPPQRPGSPTVRRTSLESGMPRAAAFAWKAVRRASPIRTSPRIQARPTSIASPGPAVT